MSTEVSSRTKNPDRVKGGQIGSARRWADPANRRVVRLDDLSLEDRAVVLALVNAKRSDHPEAA